MLDELAKAEDHVRAAVKTVGVPLGMAATYAIAGDQKNGLITCRLLFLEAPRQGLRPPERCKRDNQTFIRGEEWFPPETALATLHDLLDGKGVLGGAAVGPFQGARCDIRKPSRYPDRKSDWPETEVEVGTGRNPSLPNGTVIWGKQRYDSIAHGIFFWVWKTVEPARDLMMSGNHLPYSGSLVVIVPDTRVRIGKPTWGTNDVRVAIDGRLDVATLTVHATAIVRGGPLGGRIEVPLDPAPATAITTIRVPAQTEGLKVCVARTENEEGDILDEIDEWRPGRYDTDLEFEVDETEETPGGIFPADIEAVREENAMEEWDAFVSHASEDKAEVAEPLVRELERLGLRIWFDKSELKIGDSLSRKIDQGLAKSKFGIVVLSHAFFRKNWPQRELQGLAAREVASATPDGKVILPVWHKITHKEVLAYSPSLADKLAGNTDNGIEALARDLADVIRGGSTP